MNRIISPGKSLIGALALLALIFSLTGTAAAQNKRRRAAMDSDDPTLNAKQGKRLEGLGAGMPLRVWARALKLSDDQIFRMRQISRRNSDEVWDLDDQIRSKRQQLERSLYNESFNEDALKQQAQELGKLETQRIMLRVRILSQIRQLLTPEQLRTFNELRFGQNNGANQSDNPTDGNDTGDQPEPQPAKRNN